MADGAFCYLGDLSCCKFNERIFKDKQEVCTTMCLFCLFVNASFVHVHESCLNLRLPVFWVCIDLQQPGQCDLHKGGTDTDVDGLDSGVLQTEIQECTGGSSSLYS